MMNLNKLLFLLDFIVVSVYANAAKTITTPVPGFKKIWIYGNTSNPASVAIILSGDGGWVLGVVDVANSLAKQNALVIGVNTVHYQKYLRSVSSSCYDVATDFHNLGVYVQKRYSISRHYKPIVIGYSLGATLTYGILAQSEPGTFKGAISLGFCNDIEISRSLCEGNGLESKKRKGKGFDLQPSKRLKDPFYIIQGLDDKECPCKHAKTFAEETAKTEIITLPHIRHGSLSLRKWIPSILIAYDKILKS